MRALAVMLSSMLCACSAAMQAPQDSGVPFDAGLHDAGTEDAGVTDAGTLPDSGVADAGGQPDAGKAANCASTFGDALTNSFGRVDGTVTAVVAPADQQCALPNGDHVVVQLSMNGAIYRMVVNVQGNGQDNRVGLLTREGALPSAWEEGWHTDAGLDYPTLGVHSTDSAFALHPMEELIPLVVDPIRVGSKISVFATSSGGATAASAHLIHRNGAMRDGALVLEADSASPHWLLFRFPNQSF
ncbi:MAG: hypothetical protein IPJ65_00270 [Archangiaceae bacterium]|nr:hypothetical protein [Archangiaceae bacterium]